jgi:PIN domain nuclease of toxin-antitoxin system
MKLLLDTCAFLWVITNDPQLSSKAAAAFRDPVNDVYLSAASVWEIAVKCGNGKLTLPSPPEICVPAYRASHGIAPLDIDEAAALLVHTLPAHHRDPFDRMLVCQALVHHLTILTPDPLIAKYAVPTLW